MVSEFVVNFLHEDRKVIAKGASVEEGEDFFEIGNSRFRKENVDYIYEKEPAVCRTKGPIGRALDPRCKDH